MTGPETITPLTSRERFVQVARHQLRGHVVLPYDLNVRWFMDETLQRWRAEGLPADADPCVFFDLDRIEFVSGMPYDPLPAFEEKVIADEGDTMLMQNRKGAVVRVNKAHPEACMPQWVDYPIKSRRDFEAFRERLRSEDPARHPADWDAFVGRCRGRSHPLGIAPGSFYGHTLQQWVGPEQLCLLFYDDPDLVRDMLDVLEEFFFGLIERYVTAIDFDFASFGEDIAYKGRSFLSPHMFREFIQPHYHRSVALMRAHGIDTIFVDSDGYIDELVPLWLEAGINGFSPLEVAAGEDARVLKQRHGEQVVLAGNVDKRALIAGGSAIDREVEKVAALLESGGYFPMVDHSVPPEVPFENFCRYLEQVKALSR